MVGERDAGHVSFLPAGAQGLLAETLAGRCREKRLVFPVLVLLFSLLPQSASRCPPGGEWQHPAAGAPLSGPAGGTSVNFPATQPTTLPPSPCPREVGMSALVGERAPPSYSLLVDPAQPQR